MVRIRSREVVNKMLITLGIAVIFTVAIVALTFDGSNEYRR